MLQREARRMGMVPVYGSSGDGPAHASPPTRNPQRSTSPVRGTIFAHRECIGPPIDRPSSSPDPDATSPRPGGHRTPSPRAKSERLMMPPACIDDDDSADARDDKAKEAPGAVYYQSKDKSRLLSCAGSQHPFATRDLGPASTTGRVAGEEAQGSVGKGRAPQDRGYDHRGLELLLNALERPDNAGL